MIRSRNIAAATAFLLAIAAPSPAQVHPGSEADDGDAPAREDAPLVFVDCNRCDMSHIRREITFVNYVRDPAIADVHILITDQPTGSGGRMYTLAFSGRRPFAGLDNTIMYAAQQSFSAAQERDGLTGRIKLGLVPYVARTPLASQLAVAFSDPGTSAAAPARDPWNNWTFEVYGGGNFSEESTQGSWNARYGFYANRVTEDWKIRLRPYFNHNNRVIRREDSDDIRIKQRRHGFESYLIRSVGPRIGAGFFMDYLTATFDNIEHGVTITPAIEYSIFPYSEASRRQVTFTYRIGYELADYYEETIYEKTQESLANHSMNATVRYRQPWGSVTGGLTGLRYFHDSSHHRLTFNGNVSLRLGRGVSLNVGGNHQRINDQLNLPRGDASLEDILLQRRRLATTYRTAGSIGLSYTFGSIYTNVVNPRL